MLCSCFCELGNADQTSSWSRLAWNVAGTSACLATRYPSEEEHQARGVTINYEHAIVIAEGQRRELYLHRLRGRTSHVFGIESKQLPAGSVSWLE